MYKTLAIVGCGAAAVSFLKSFISQCNLYQIRNIKLIIFEPSQLGVGLAYQEDLDSLLINRPAQTMSVNFEQQDEFYNWIKEHKLYCVKKEKITKEKLLYPPQNARLLSTLLEKKQLFAIAGLEQLTYDYEKKKYIARTKDGNFSFDWVINATGASRYIQPEDELLYNLIQSNICRHHPFGGVDVDFSTSSIINGQNKVNKNIKIIGHNTIGVFSYTSSLEMISIKANALAINFAELIKKDLFNDQNQMANPATADWPGHFATGIH